MFKFEITFPGLQNPFVSSINLTFLTRQIQLFLLFIQLSLAGLHSLQFPVPLLVPELYFSQPGQLKMIKVLSFSKFRTS